MRSCVPIQTQYTQYELDVYGNLGGGIENWHDFYAV
jgi:hypothetical protein